MKRYHPVLVTLHWLLALMIIGGLIMGSNVLSATPNADPAKLTFLKMHMIMGTAILVLMVLRFVIRLFIAKPPHADIGQATLKKLAIAAHYAFYVVVLAMAASGLATAFAADLPAIIFGDSGASLPASFDNIPPRAAHGALAVILTLLIAGHFAAFLYHQYVRKDSLFSRMWYGNRK